MSTVTASQRFDFKDTPPYRATRSPVQVEVPPMTFLTVVGEGHARDGAFQEAVETLYPVAYALKVALKEARRLDWVIPPLEALWWSSEGGLEAARNDPGRLRWRAMLAQPPEVRADDVEPAIDAAARRHRLPLLESLRFDPYDEGISAQVLYVGPYSQEEETIRTLLEFVAARRRTPRLPHHEIYLSDPNRTAPERLRTIIRQPMG